MTEKKYGEGLTGWQNAIRDLSSTTPASQPSPAKVGCETDEGLLNIHPESETCEVCQPSAARSDRMEAEREACAKICDRLEAMMVQGGGETRPGERLAQAARLIRERASIDGQLIGAPSPVKQEGIPEGYECLLCKNNHGRGCWAHKACVAESAPSGGSLLDEEHVSDLWRLAAGNWRKFAADIERRALHAARRATAGTTAAPSSEATDGEGGPTDRLISMLHTQRERLLAENTRLRATAGNAAPTEPIGFTDAIALENFDKGRSDELYVVRHTNELEKPIPVFATPAATAAPGDLGKLTRFGFCDEGVDFGEQPGGSYVLLHHVEKLLASNARAAIPEGFALAPIKMTPAMAAALSDGTMGAGWMDYAQKKWSAMLAAAPSNSPAGAQEKEQ